MAGGGMQSLREIHQRPLDHIHQRDKSAERASGYNEPFEQRHGSSIPWGPEAIPITAYGARERRPIHKAHAHHIEWAQLFQLTANF